MRTLMHRLLLLLPLIAVALAGHADEPTVLWWLVDPDDEVDWYGQTKTVEDLRPISARVRVDKDGVTDGYLTFWMLTEDGDVIPEGDVGFPSFSVPVEAYADVSAYGGASYSFAIELGNYESGTWVARVTSEASSYTDLVAAHHIDQWDGINPVPGQVWHPATYSVPEPSSGLLMLIGGALLALRRRKGR